MKKRILITGFLIASLSLVACSKTPEKNDISTSSDEQVQQIQETKVEFTGKTIDGKNIDSSIFKDYKLTMINIWGTYCDPCIKEMPDLQKLSEEAKKLDVNVLGIVNDASSEDTIELAKKILTEKGVKFDNLSCDENLEKGLLKNLMGVPTTIFVDKDGKIVGEEIIGAQSRDSYMDNIKKLLESEK